MTPEEKLQHELNDVVHAKRLERLGRTSLPDPFVKSWELAVQLVAPMMTTFYQEGVDTENARKAVEEAQKWFYEKLKGGTDGK